MCKISVLIPTYNVSDWIVEALDSICNQKIYNETILEVIVIDDSSTDDTFGNIQSYAEINLSCNIVLDRNVENLKICKTLNKALSIATGDYIARFDGDDIALPNRLKIQLDYLIKNDLDLVGCQMIAIDEMGNEISRGSMPVGQDKIIKSAKYASPIAHIWLAKKEVYDALGGYRNIPYVEDYDFVLRALDLGFRCDNVPEHLMLIRHRSGNTASTASLLQRKYHNYVLELHRRRLINNGIDGFSEEELFKISKTNKIVNFLHKKSTHLLSSAYKEKIIIIKFMKIFISVLLSPYNASYLISRLLFKLSYK